MLQKRNQNAKWKFIKSIEIDGTGEFDVLVDGRVFMQFKCTNCGNIHTAECGDSLPEICNICNSDMKNINGAKYYGTSKWNYNGHTREYYNNDPDMGKELIFSCDKCGGVYTTNNRTLLPKMCSRCNSKMENWVEGLTKANEILEENEKTSKLEVDEAKRQLKARLVGPLISEPYVGPNMSESIKTILDYVEELEDKVNGK